MQQFVSTKDYQTVWKLKTIMSQDGNEIILEKNCNGYFTNMSGVIEGNMAFVISSWDNSDR